MRPMCASLAVSMLFALPITCFAQSLLVSPINAASEDGRSRNALPFGDLTQRLYQLIDIDLVTGTKLIREWDGIEHTVTVMKDGFDWQGRKFKSLSAVAREITGTRWNGYRFFGLRERKREEV